MKNAATLVLIVGLLAALATARDMAPVAVKGKATFQQDGNNWTISTASDRTVINWRHFGVARGATVDFRQPGADSAVLNRVVGSRASHINGLLRSNGGVYLLNPNGIVIGPGGTVNVARFIASTLCVDDEQFLAGRDIEFTGMSPASIENYGKIDAIGGDIYLIAANVVNAGTLAAPAGSVNLVAATNVLLTQDNNIFVRPSLDADGSPVGVDNRGVIEAVVARLQADGNMYALAINNAGVVRATGSVQADGRVLLRADGGSVVNSGSLVARTVQADGATTGGEVLVLGSDVAIDAGATIDASGDLGGGRILIGGDRQGANPLVPNAQTTGIEPGAAIIADALVRGDGGTIIVWSDNATTVRGAISARGAAGGSGGFVETSGGTLDFQGMDLSCGAGGTWMIDPPALDYTINAGNVGSIVGQLNTDASVWIPGANIFVNADVVAAPSLATTFLRLDATDSIALNANVDIGVGSLQLWANSGIAQKAGTSAVAGTCQILSMGSGGGSFLLDQPGNDFGTIGVLVTGKGSTVVVQDVNDLKIGNVGMVHGVSAVGGYVSLGTPNGFLVANGLFPRGIIRGYSAIGNAAIAESSWGSETYEIKIANDPPSLPAAVIEGFLGSSLDDLDAQTRIGSAVRIHFIELAGDSLGYDWNFQVREAFANVSPNDYSFIKFEAGNTPSFAEKLVDIETARTSKKQMSGEFSWQTGWAGTASELNHTDTYNVCFGAMNVENNDYKSQLLLRNIQFVGHILPPEEEFVFDRIFDHVEDFPHIRPDQRAGAAGAGPLAPVIEEVNTYFDQSARGVFYDESTKSVDPRYYYQSVGSIYQIPR